MASSTPTPGQMRWAGVVREAARQLDDAGFPSGMADARLLAQAVCASSSSPLWESHVVSEGEYAHFTELMNRRLAGHPVQHVTGRMYFRYLELESRPGVFIVRPETEIVAQAAIDAVNEACGYGMNSTPGAAGASDNSRPTVIDLCAGSGAIGLAIATETNARVIAVELSPIAAASAARNAARLRASGQLRPGAYRLILGNAATANLPRADVVVSNPPYVPEGRDVPRDVHHDPALALYSGSDGLDLPRRLIARAAQVLAPGGTLIMEHGEEQGEALALEARAHGFTNVHIGSDLTGRPRYLSGRNA